MLLHKRLRVSHYTDCDLPRCQYFGSRANTLGARQILWDERKYSAKKSAISLQLLQKDLAVQFFRWIFVYLLNGLALLCVCVCILQVCLCISVYLCSVHMWVFVQGASVSIWAVCTCEYLKCWPTLNVAIICQPRPSAPSIMQQPSS